MNPLFHNFFNDQVRAFTTDRSVDFSTPKGKFDFNFVQRRELKDLINNEIEDVGQVRQVHGNKIVVLEKVPRTIEEADGMITNLKKLPIVIRTADCLPIFLYDPKSQVIGLVHAGWKGTKLRIVKEALNSMVEHFGCQMKDIQAAFGPAISREHYEVKDEFNTFFAYGVQNRGGQHYLDLSFVNRCQLLESGISEEHIFDSGICTFSDERCFSYRKEGEQCGRMLSLMELN